MRSQDAYLLIGSGRVASHLSATLSRSGFPCVGVFSKTIAHAEERASHLGCQAITSVDALNTLLSSAQPPRYLILSISDDALPEMVSALKVPPQTVVIHTSGSTPLSVLSPFVLRGVLYPLQTFSKGREIDLREVPFFIESNSEEATEAIEHLLREIAVRQVLYCDSTQRAKLHVAAVFCCNFLNHLLTISDDLVQSIGFSMEVLTPLIRETVAKALAYPPASVQTGPAVRGDQSTINRHLEILSKHKNIQELYRSLNQSIYQYYHEQDK